MGKDFTEGAAGRRFETIRSEGRCGCRVQRLMGEEPSMNVHVFQVESAALGVVSKQLLQPNVLNLGKLTVAQGGEQPP
jgi:hypothetical protein